MSKSRNSFSFFFCVMFLYPCSSSSSSCFPDFFFFSSSAYSYNPFLSSTSHTGEPTPKTVGRNGFRSPTRHEHVGPDSVVKIIKAAVKSSWRNIFSADCYFIGHQHYLQHTPLLMEKKKKKFQIT